MSSYTEIDTALLDLDFTNPRIQNYLQAGRKQRRRITCYAARNWN